MCVCIITRISLCIYTMVSNSVINVTNEIIEHPVAGDNTSVYSCEFRPVGCGRTGCYGDEDDKQTGQGHQFHVSGHLVYDLAN